MDWVDLHLMVSGEIVHDSPALERGQGAAPPVPGGT